ncbi:hypothetical protein [Gracilinema caldarium]|uniref:hypothetical protein n=1 Tax=Gracilinema caldarium TaxID=215591 RepID=UPI0002F1DE81|nr:hypothetical protein [Gracilinema caldarium]
MAQFPGLIITFGALFLAMFIAFVLEWIESIRKDPEAMAKIREALAHAKKA